MSPLILIVDDEPDLIATLEYNLRREGYETRSAQNGREALAAFGKTPTADAHRRPGSMATSSNPWTSRPWSRSYRPDDSSLEGDAAELLASES